MINKPYSNLSFFCSYFGPSWKTDFGDISRAILFFFKTSNAEVQRAISVEIGQFLREHPDDRNLLMKLIGMGFNYNPKRQNLTLRQWLLNVQKQIDDRLKTKDTREFAPPIPQKPLNGAPGNTSSDRHRRPKTRSEVKSILPGVGLFVCVAVFIFGLIWAKEQFYGNASPSPWGLICIFVGTSLVLAYLPKVPTRVKKTSIFTTFFLLFVIATYRGLFQAANQAVGGVMHQIGSDAPSPPAPQPSYSPSPVIALPGARPASPRLNGTVEESCVQRGFVDNWQWKTIDIKPGDPEHVLTSKGILLPGNRVQICADAETQQDLHKLLVWVGAEPNASGASTWRPDSKSKKVWYVDKRIQFGFKADAEPGGYLHFLADGELKNNLRVYVWIGM